VTFPSVMALYISRDKRAGSVSRVNPKAIRRVALLLASSCTTCTGSQEGWEHRVALSALWAPAGSARAAPARPRTATTPRQQRHALAASRAPPAGAPCRAQTSSPAPSAGVACASFPSAHSITRKQTTKMRMVWSNFWRARLEFFVAEV